MISIKRYSAEHNAAWNDFNSRCRNGHFMFHRDFMDYHADRIEDYSLLIYDKEKLTGIYPASLQDDLHSSHGGLSFGGLLYTAKSTTVNVMEMMQGVLEYLRGEGIKRAEYKALPAFYTQGECAEHLYVLSMGGWNLTRRDVASVIDYRSHWPYRSLKKRNLKKAVKENFEVVELSDLAAYWKMLTDVLRQHHDTDPVHSLEEITLLKSRFPENIKCFVCQEGGEALAGTVLFINGEVVHTQYLAASERGRATYALDLVLDYLVKAYAEKNFKFFSFGISTEEEGKKLNEGLIFQKEGFGARAAVHDFYRIEL